MLRSMRDIMFELSKSILGQTMELEGQGRTAEMKRMYAEMNDRLRRETPAIQEPIPRTARDEARNITRRKQPRRVTRIKSPHAIPASFSKFQGGQGYRERRRRSLQFAAGKISFPYAPV